MNKNSYIFLIVVFLIIVSIFLLESRKTDRNPNMNVDDQSVSVEQTINENVSTQSKEEREKRIKLKEKQYELAKEISTPDGFINVDDITVRELIGKKIILVDFWTYSCINCQRTLPYLNSWNEKYADQGLVILGVHTPEFEFEKDYDNVKKAVDKYGIKYPVILDNDYSTWTSYKNRYWPRKYLIDIDGFIVYDHIGEGAYDETEEKIVELLNEKNKVLGLENINVSEDKPKEIDNVIYSQVRSPEMYFGYSRLEYLANLPSTSCFDSSCDYTPTSEINLNTFLLDGNWNIGKENTSLNSDQGAIILAFSANKVNLVAGSSTGKDIKAEIYLDGELVNNSNSGIDVKDGIVTFNEHDLYNLIDLNGEYGEHIIIIKILDDNFESFAFTFG